MTPLEEARKHLHDALDGILSGGCKSFTVVRIEMALEKLDEYEKSLPPDEDKAADTSVK